MVQDLVGAYVCFIVLALFELVLLIKIFSGQYSKFTLKVLLLLVFALAFAIASA